MNRKIQQRDRDVPRISDIGTVRGTRIETDTELRQRLAQRRTHSDVTMWSIVGLALIVGVLMAIVCVIWNGGLP